MQNRYRLTLSCHDRLGIVAGVPTCLAANLSFFMRMTFDLADPPVAPLKRAFEAVASLFDMRVLCW